MKKYNTPLIKINMFDSTIETTNVSGVIDYIYATEVVNKVGFTEYFSQRATSTKIQEVLKFK